MPTLTELRECFAARPTSDGSFNLAGHDPAATPFVESKSEAKDQLDDELADDLYDQHELMYANAENSTLLVLQGVDCSGKNGTIKHVVIKLNPAFVRCASFTEPTEEEKERHFLWRHRQWLPPRGHLAVFDRSHYEDLLVPMVEETLDVDDLQGRVDDINEFERELTDDGTLVIKCLLHISYDEQRERFLRRLRREDKRWKFSESDIETRRCWDEYQAAYGQMVAATTPDHAPWYVIPADHKWYRNWAVANLLVEHWRQFEQTYPQPGFDLDFLRHELEPPH